MILLNDGKAFSLPRDVGEALKSAAETLLSLSQQQANLLESMANEHDDRIVCAAALVVAEFISSNFTEQEQLLIQAAAGDALRMLGHEHPWPEAEAFARQVLEAEPSVTQLKVGEA